MSNEDILLITASGKYECKVVNPNSNCPFDTTPSVLEYDCGVGIENNYDYTQNLFWSIFPNPASETLAIKFTKNNIQDQIQIYNAMGHLVKVKEASELAIINISALPAGVYFIRLKTINNQH
ncbi:MAG: hypothetical protein COB15_05935 [Flavobacteriales bacterium]|nr:MAG: hypothetical protein COB15_05935 [Flavobacteriales bacterium]